MSKEILVIEKGDKATFDFSGYHDGVQFEGGTAHGYTMVIGSNQFIPGFEEQMFGMKVEEKKDIAVQFPFDYHARHLAGEEVIFKVKVHAINKKK